MSHEKHNLTNRTTKYNQFILPDSKPVITKRKYLDIYSYF